MLRMLRAFLNGAGGAKGSPLTDAGGAQRMLLGGSGQVRQHLSVRLHCCSRLIRACWVEGRGTLCQSSCTVTNTWLHTPTHILTGPFYGGPLGVFESARL